MTTGEFIRRRREGMGLSLNQLSTIMDGSPAPSFLSRIENDESQPGEKVALRMASALRLPPDKLLNAFGLATREQRQTAEAFPVSNMGGTGGTGIPATTVHGNGIRRMPSTPYSGHSSSASTSGRTGRSR